MNKKQVGRTSYVVQHSLLHPRHIYYTRKASRSRGPMTSPTWPLTSHASREAYRPRTIDDTQRFRTADRISGDRRKASAWLWIWIITRESARAYHSARGRGQARPIAGRAALGRWKIYPSAPPVRGQMSISARPRLTQIHGLIYPARPLNQPCCPFSVTRERETRV